MTAELAIIFPCFNELPHLHASIQRIRDFVGALNFDVQVVFVDDGSTDGTREILATLEIPNFSAIFHASNLGRGAAVASGIRAVSCPLVSYCDIDMEVDVFQILNLVDAIRMHGEVVIGRRIYNVSPRSVHRYILSVGYQYLSSLYLGMPRQDTESGFKIFRRLEILPVLDTIRSSGWFWDTESVVRAHLMGLEVREIPVLFTRRFDKASSVRLVRDTFRYLVELRRFGAEIRRQPRATHLRERMNAKVGMNHTEDSALSAPAGS